MTFFFQQPDADALLDVINEQSKDAESGGGIFAFATKGGVEAFFGLPGINAMLTAGKPFHLIVGIDAITNAEALLCLGEEVATHSEALKVQVFLHEQAPSTFHPKFAWFLKQGEIRLITGSGNLTERGLGKQSMGQLSNWEAFSVQSLFGKKANAVKKDLNDWLVAQDTAGTLCSLNDSRVLEKAMANARVRYAESGKPSIKSKAAPKPKTLAQAGAAVDEKDNLNTMEVLIRELSKNRNGQGDIGQTSHNKFFGHNGTDKYIFMQYVDLKGHLYPVREVWLFYNEASDNYRLELPESKGDYEKGNNDERMVLVAVKLDERSFRYTILRPKTDRLHYNKVSAFLGSMKKGKRRLMRERFASADELLSAWNKVPSNLLPVCLPITAP